MIERLTCEIKENAWGDLHAIADLRGVAATGRPQAELWMGAHQGAPSIIASSGAQLDEAIAAHPLEMLGEASSIAGGKLPFLFKVLAAAKALSIQVHPTKPQAEAGFERENAAGIGVAEPGRTYRDDNHKPELIAALSHFRALCGFRDLSQTVSLISAMGLPELQPLLDRLQRHEPATADAGLAEAGLADVEIADVEIVDAVVIEDVVGWILSLSASEVVRVVEALVRVGESLPRQFCWVPQVDEAFPGDVGLLVGLFLNYIELESGEAVFLGAGNVHSYLSGLAVEIMANSDNVVRAGLTPKNIDVAELMSIASFAPIAPPIQRRRGSSQVYESPVPEFSLERIDASVGSRLTVSGPEIVLATDAAVMLSNDSGFSLALNPGEAAFVSAGEDHYLVSGSGLAWRATVGS